MINSEWLFAVHAMSDGYPVGRGIGSAPHRFGPDDYAKWQEYRDSGMSFNKISKLTGASPTTIRERLAGGLSHESGR